MRPFSKHVIRLETAREGADAEVAPDNSTYHFRVLPSDCLVSTQYRDQSNQSIHS
jgi:hypothetical protein